MENLKLHADGKRNHRNDLIKEMGKKIKSILGSDVHSERKSIEIKKVKDEYGKIIENLDNNLY